MSESVLGILLCIAAYFAGATPFGYLVARLIGRIDIRQHGSGNIGATNVGRVLGTKWGLFVFALDFGKGTVPVYGLPLLFIGSEAESLLHWRVATGVMTVLGHMFPIWLGFRGGKGVATALGVVACLAPWPTVVAFGAFVFVFLVWRIVSLSSIVASLAFSACQLTLLWPALFDAKNWSLSTFSLVVPALIVIRHRTNIARLLRGEEPRYRSGKSDSTNS